VELRIPHPAWKTGRPAGLLRRRRLRWRWRGLLLLLWWWWRWGLLLPLGRWRWRCLALLWRLRRRRRRGSSGLPCGCWRQGSGSGARELLCPPDSVILWRLGASSPMKDPSPRRSLRDLSSLRSRLLRELAASDSFSLPEGAGDPWLDPPGLGSARWWLSGEVPGIQISRLGSALTCRTARPPSSRVGSDARIAVRIAWSSHRALIPLGSTSSSRAYASPVIPQIRTSSSRRTDPCRPRA
jgi:hypothetical protein